MLQTGKELIPFLVCKSKFQGWLGVPPREGALCQSLWHIYLDVDPALFSLALSQFPFAYPKLRWLQWDRERCRCLTEPPHPQHTPQSHAVWFWGSRRTRESSKNYLLIPVQKWNSFGILEVFVITKKISPASLSRSFAPYSKLCAPFSLDLSWCFPWLAQPPEAEAASGCFRVWPSSNKIRYI